MEGKKKKKKKTKKQRNGERKEKDGKGSRIPGVRDAHAAAWRSANVVSRARLCVRPCKEGVCIGLVPRRSRLKLITSSSDVTGLCPMRANSLAASIARYHFTGFYLPRALLYRPRNIETSGRYLRLEVEASSHLFNRPFCSRESRCFREKRLYPAENAA